MKKEALVFVLFITVFFVLGVGCVQQKEDINFSKTKELNDWLESFPKYYSSENIEAEFQEQIGFALETQDIRECEKIIMPREDEEATTDKKVEALHQCSELLTKKEAFSQKSFQVCDKLYEPNKDNLAYEECVAPIAAFLSITKEDKSLCERNLEDKELTRICEDDYEKFN